MLANDENERNKFLNDRKIQSKFEHFTEISEQRNKPYSSIVVSYA